MWLGEEEFCNDVIIFFYKKFLYGILYKIMEKKNFFMGDVFNIYEFFEKVSAGNSFLSLRFLNEL